MNNQQETPESTVNFYGTQHTAGMSDALIDEDRNNGLEGELSIKNQTEAFQIQDM